MSPRWLVTALILCATVVQPAHASGCVLAVDDMGDGTAPMGVPVQGADLERVTVNVSGHVLTFKIMVDAIPDRPQSPTSASFWQLWFGTPAGPLQINLVRDFYGDSATAAIGAPPGRSAHGLAYELDKRTRTLTVVLSHRSLGLPDRANLVGDKATAGTISGVFLPPSDGSSHNVGVSSTADRASVTRTVVTGRGCR